MPTYRFTGAYARFYPQERDANGQSLMAGLGTVHDWDSTPEDGQWILVEASNQPDQGADMGASAEPAREAAPVVVQEAPEPEPVPVTPEPAPEPPWVSTDVPEPQPEPVAPVAPTFPAPAWSSANFPFPGFARASQPYTR